MIQPILCPACRQENSPRARFCRHCRHDVTLNNAGPRYYLTRVIKEGGQGAVYLAVGEDGAPYAVKEMLDDFSDPQERAQAVERFTEEAQTLQQLRHPQVPRVYAAFHDEGRHYLVMDFVRGEDLEELVRRGGPLAEDQALALAEQICAVLSFLHSRGVVYRDMKPANVMLEPGGAIKLIDFGVAKLFHPTARGTQIGTPGYAPPEQYQGLATPVSDVYALGATLHHLLTGRDPQQHAPFQFPPVRSLAPAVSERTAGAIARAVQLRPADRFHTIDSLWENLEPGPATSASAPTPAQAATMPVPPTPPSLAATPAPQHAPVAPTTVISPTPPTIRAQRRTNRTLAGCAIVVLLLGIVLMGGIMLTRPAPPPPPTIMPQQLIARPYRVDGLEIIVPAGTDAAGIDRAFASAFAQLASLECGCQAEIRPGSLIYRYGAGPARLGGGPEGERYRASIEGMVLQR